MPFNPSSQNSRVDGIPGDLPRRRSDLTAELASEIIEKCYRQIFFHAMSSDRDLSLESQFKSGSITVRDFIRGLLLSERFYNGYIACNSNDRIVEQVVGRVLGRPVYGADEKDLGRLLLLSKDSRLLPTPYLTLLNTMRGLVMMRYLNKSIESCQVVLRETCLSISDCLAMGRVGANV